MSNYINFSGQVNTEVIAGEGMIVTAGAIDCHVHFICPQLAFEAITSGEISLTLIFLILYTPGMLEKSFTDKDACTLLCLWALFNSYKLQSIHLVKV